MSDMLSTLTLAFALLACVFARHAAGLRQLDANNFEQLVRSKPGSDWLVEFYSSMCMLLIPAI